MYTQSAITFYSLVASDSSQIPQNRARAMRKMGSCHRELDQLAEAEQVLLRISQGSDAPENEHDYSYEHSPKALYEKIGSSHEQAVKASEFLK